MKLGRDDAVQEREPIAYVLKRLKLPDCPPCFEPDGFEARGTWGSAMAELKAASIDDSGPRKALAELRPLAWAIFLVGGSLSGELAKIQQFQTAHAEARARRARLKSDHAQPHLVEEAEGEIRAAERNLDELKPLVEAGSRWSAKDNRTLHETLVTAQGQVDAIDSRIAPYRAARLPTPPGWEESLFKAQQELSAAASAFAAGCDVYSALSLAAREARDRTLAAMRSASVGVAVHDGVRTKQAIPVKDVSFLDAFPHRASDEILTHYRHAERISAIVEHFGGGPHSAMEAFWAVIQDERLVRIIRGKLHAGRSPVRATTSEPPQAVEAV
jgi:hypothetical protein